MKDQITHLPDNADRSVAKQKFKITNWPTYNKALINRGSITFWLDDEAIQAWYESTTPSSRGRPQRYSDRKRTARTVLTGMCYSVGSVMRQGSSSLTRLTGQSAMTSRTWRR
ncbi:TPA: hypothetical protein ME468_004796 [Klebsiella pneumoniae]|nr:hypothetical protein [Klebsiella pneumoniae]